MERIGHEAEPGTAAGERAITLPPGHEFANSPALDLGVAPLSPLLASGERDSEALDHMSDTLKINCTPDRENPMGTEALKVMLSSVEGYDVDGYTVTPNQRRRNLLGILRSRVTEATSDDFKEASRPIAIANIDEAIGFYAAALDEDGAAAGEFVAGGGAGGGPAGPLPPGLDRFADDDDASTDSSGSTESTARSFGPL